MRPVLLRYADVAGDVPYLAAFVSFAGAGTTSGVLHTHDFTEFTLLRRGRAEHRVNGRVLPVRAGDLVYVRAADAHHFQAVDDAGCDIVNVAFPSSQWQRFCRLAGFAAVDTWQQAELPWCRNMNGTGLDGEFDEMARRSARGPHSLDAVALWTSIARAVPAAVDRDHGLAPAWLRRAREALRTEEDLTAGVPRLLEVAAVSRGHLARAMGRYFDQTPVDFVDEQRLAYAVQLLGATDEPIGSVADRCGFASQSYFDRRFVRRYGCPPREWRSRARRAVRP